MRNVSTIEELEQCIFSHGKDALYRGQTKCYSDVSGEHQLTTSFSRHGCIPSQMLKWTHYAESVILALTGPSAPTPSMQLVQAVLQHYGWRSFYVDATGDSKVAAWFASHKFHRTPSLELHEDCFEDPIFLVLDRAQYLPSANNLGYLYILDRAQLAKEEVEIVDLSESVKSEQRLRFHVQAGFLLRPKADALPANCIKDVIAAPVEILSSYANQGGFSTSDLFPSPVADPVLSLLLATPWSRIKNDDRIPYYSRGLRIPEYQPPVFRKILSPREGFYTGAWIGDSEHLSTTEFRAAFFLRVEEGIAFGTADLLQPFPLISKLLDTYTDVAIELDGLTRYPEYAGKSEYQKGVFLRKGAAGIEVSTLLVEHPGMQLRGFGAAAPWTYRIDSQKIWNRAVQGTDCPCNAPTRHEANLLTVARVEYLLRYAKATYISKNTISITRK